MGWFRDQWRGCEARCPAHPWGVRCMGEPPHDDKPHFVVFPAFPTVEIGGWVKVQWDDTLLDLMQRAS